MRLYPRLAWEGIRRNRRICLPYFLACGGMVMMFYIIHYLASMPALARMKGGPTVAQMLGFGVWIVILFAALFLLYTNSFLIRRRQREFGLYNLLGMGKGNLCLVYLWETGMLFAGAMALGLALGVLLSKLAELGLLRVLGETASYTFTVSGDALHDAFVVFVPIFGLILLRGLWSLGRLSTVSLLKSESVGEKPPRANWLLGVGGALILAAAYYIAVSIRNPLAALAWFFIAVGMVIVATYLLFIAGSVLLCRLLQKNRRYYYRKNHFVSVSSMLYRMKRNGAGLASTCILSTMVLVMMLGAGSLYFGAEDSLLARYPRQINVSMDFIPTDGREYTPEKEQALLERVDTVLAQHGAQVRNEERYRTVWAIGLLREGRLTLDPMTVNAADLATMNDVYHVYFLPLEDYNRAMGADETLEAGEVLLHCVRRSYQEPAITMADGTVWTIKKQVDDIMGSGAAAMYILPSVFLVVSDLDAAVTSVNFELGGEYGAHTTLQWSFDTGLEAQEQAALGDAIRESLRELDYTGTGGFYAGSVECREAERGGFYGTYGGIFYLGILLSIVFLAATVLIIYYKQITEGYEDESRFAIMRKVGMTAEDIRQSVNSQLLTVFFLPLVTAVVHTAFAFPMVRRLLALFNMCNTPLMCTVLAGSVLAFGLVYALIYKATSNAYYTIVSGLPAEG